MFLTSRFNGSSQHISGNVFFQDNNFPYDAVVANSLEVLKLGLDVGGH